MKKIIMLVFMCLLIIPCIVYASTQGHNSYLQLPADQQVEGSVRSYSYSNHKVIISADSVSVDSEPKRLVVSLNKKTFFSSTQQARTTVSFNLGTCFTVFMGNHGSGNKWYGFGSYENSLKDGSAGHGTVYSGIYSDNVQMISYN